MTAQEKVLYFRDERIPYFILAELCKVKKDTVKHWAGGHTAPIGGNADRLDYWYRLLKKSRKTSPKGLT